MNSIDFDRVLAGAVAIGAGERGAIGAPVDPVRRTADGVAQCDCRTDKKTESSAIQVLHHPYLIVYE